MKKTVKRANKLQLSRETLRDLGQNDLGAIDGAGSTPTLPQFCRSGYKGSLCTNLFCV